MELDAELMAVTPRRATVANRDATYRHVDPWMPEASAEPSCGEPHWLEQPRFLDRNTRA